jgi:hypothetical protein
MKLKWRNPIREIVPVSKYPPPAAADPAGQIGAPVHFGAIAKSALSAPTDFGAIAKSALSAPTDFGAIAKRALGAPKSVGAIAFTYGSRDPNEKFSASLKHSHHYGAKRHISAKS